VRQGVLAHATSIGNLGIEEKRTLRSPLVSTRWILISVLFISILPLRPSLAQKAIGASSAASSARIPQESPAAAYHPNVEGYRLSAEKYALAVSYRHGEYWIYFLTTAYGLLLIWAMIRWRVAPHLRDWAERISRRTWIQLLLYTPALVLIFTVPLFPIDAFSQWHARKYDISIQAWPYWFGDWMLTETSILVSGTLAVGPLYFAIRSAPKRWWFFLWMIGIPLLVLFAFLQPVAIDPLFNTIQPLDDSHPELVDAIEKLLSRSRLVIPREHINLLKVSDKSTVVDASSEGFGPTKRIFVSDTIIASEPGSAILHTLAHEIGHYMLWLDWIVFAISVPLSLGMLYLIHRAFVVVLAGWGKQWNIRGPSDFASLPVLAFIVAIIAVALTPAVNTLSRYREHEADRYGLELIHGVVPNAGEAAASAFQKDGEINLSDPAPPSFVRWWLFDHPPVNERIIFCRTYDPWSNGQKPRYIQEP
jgi:STE24 endopeptidase